MLKRLLATTPGGHHALDVDSVTGSSTVIPTRPSSAGGTAVLVKQIQELQAQVQKLVELQDTRHTTPAPQSDKSTMLTWRGGSVDGDSRGVGGGETAVMEERGTEGTNPGNRTGVAAEIASLRLEIAALRGDVAHSQQLEELPEYST